MKRTNLTKYMTMRKVGLSLLKFEQALMCTDFHFPRTTQRREEFNKLFSEMFFPSDEREPEKRKTHP